MLKAVTKELYCTLPKISLLKKIDIINTTSFKDIYMYLKKNVNKNIHIYDATISKHLQRGEIIRVNDHINKTGKNILIKKQIFLEIDFIDQSYLYKQTNEGIITECCGDYPKENFQYPSYYLCNVATLARAMGISSINGYLYRI